MDERRIMPRWQISQHAGLTFENGIRAIPCIVEDINYKGMRVSLKRELFEDVFSNFKLALSEDFEFNASASVVWCDKSEEKNTFGLLFSRINESAKNQMWAHIKNNFPELMVKHWWKGL